MVLWSAGISAHTLIFPKLIDREERDPQLRTNVDNVTAQAIKTHELEHWSRSSLWMIA
jgi:23S rRNA A1618 N6-methylase RlmF